MKQLDLLRKQILKALFTRDGIPAVVLSYIGMMCANSSKNVILS